MIGINYKENNSYCELSLKKSAYTKPKSTANEQIRIQPQGTCAIIFSIFGPKTCDTHRSPIHKIKLINRGIPGIVYFNQSTLKHNVPSNVRRRMLPTPPDVVPSRSLGCYILFPLFIYLRRF